MKMKIDYARAYSDHVSEIMSTAPQYHPFLVTKSFKPVRFDNTSSTLKRVTEHVFRENDRLYRDITSRLMTNFTRKSRQHLHPKAFHFFDLPNSEKKTSINFDRPELPHIHSIYLVHHDTLTKFNKLAFHDKFQPIVNHKNRNESNRTYPSLISIHAREIEDLVADIPNTVAYAAKLLDHSYSQHLINDDHVFFTQNPKSSSMKSAPPRMPLLLDQSKKRMKEKLAVL